MEQTQISGINLSFNLGDANTVCSRPGLWGPAKLFGVVTLLWGRSPGTVHHVPSEILHGERGLPDIWPSACIWTPFFFFLICIYLAVSCLMGSLVVACRLSWPIALGKCKANSQPLDLQRSPGWDFLACKTHSSSFQVLFSSLKDTFLSSLDDLLVGLVYSSWGLAMWTFCKALKVALLENPSFYHIICTFYEHIQWTSNQLYL